MEKMASELDMLNGEAVRESPVTETGYQGMAGVPVRSFRSQACITKAAAEEKYLFPCRGDYRGECN